MRARGPSVHAIIILNQAWYFIVRTASASALHRHQVIFSTFMQLLWSVFIEIAFTVSTLLPQAFCCHDWLSTYG